MGSGRVNGSVWALEATAHRPQRHATDEDALFPSTASCLDRNGRRTNAEGVGEHLRELPVGGAIDGTGPDADAHGPAVETRYPRT
jgi:hypothetical protein